MGQDYEKRPDLTKIKELLRDIDNRLKKMQLTDRDDIVNILENTNLKLDLKYIIEELQELGNDEIITLIKRIRVNEVK